VSFANVYRVIWLAAETRNVPFVASVLVTTTTVAAGLGEDAAVGADEPPQATSRPHARNQTAFICTSIRI
jgi:hypothetical protein